MCLVCDGCECWSDELLDVFVGGVLCGVGILVVYGVGVVV